MSLSKLLISNRGEIAIRIARAAAKLGIATVAIYSEDDNTSLHIRKADSAIPLKGQGVAAYLDMEQIVSIAKEEGCDAIHPGYGFLSENAQFAQLCANNNIIFVGPRPDILESFGDKGKAREIAIQANIPTLKGTSKATSLEEVHDFFHSLSEGNGVMIKAISGGGGRGIRSVQNPKELDKAFERCQSEAQMAFGNNELYVEQLLTHARHIEVQILGDGSGNVSHLWERDCSIQRRHQKLIEIAPAPSLPLPLREKILTSAVQMAELVRYNGLGTFEFLVDANHLSDDSEFFFLEANPRLQVEHTVTEEVTGVDLVTTQIKLAAGATLEELNLQMDQIPNPNGFAIQVRVNMERINKKGMILPSGGTIEAFDPPTGPGCRTDTFGYTGYSTSSSFDSLLAKVITHKPGRPPLESQFSDVVSKTLEALSEFRIEGLSTNIPFLQGLLQHPELIKANVYTTFIDDHLKELLEATAPLD